MNDLLLRINENKKFFSKGQKLLADFILEHYDKAGFMTACRLGESVGVSESTVVRFATGLGYDGYPGLQSAVKQMIKNKLTIVQRMEVANNRLGDNDVLDKVLASDIDKIKNTLEEIDKNAFSQAVKEILGAKKIYILGVRSSAYLAGFLGFYFNLIFDNSVLVRYTGESELFEHLMRVSSGDVVIGISFPRYSKSTINAFKFIKDRGAKAIAITDSSVSPIALCSDFTLVAKSDMASFVDSLVAPLSIINALIAAVGIKKKDEISDTLNMLENVWDEYHIYEKTTDI